MCSSMAFEIKCIVEPFSTESTKIPFDLAVTFEVSVQ